MDDRNFPKLPATLTVFEKHVAMAFEDLGALNFAAEAIQDLKHF